MSLDTEIKKFINKPINKRTKEQRITKSQLEDLKSVDDEKLLKIIFSLLDNVIFSVKNDFWYSNLIRQKLHYFQTKNNDLDNISRKQTFNCLNERIDNIKEEAILECFSSYFTDSFYFKKDKLKLMLKEEDYLKDKVEIQENEALDLYKNILSVQKILLKRDLQLLTHHESQLLYHNYFKDILNFYLPSKKILYFINSEQLSKIFHEEFLEETKIDLKNNYKKIYGSKIETEIKTAIEQFNDDESIIEVNINYLKYIIKYYFLFDKKDLKFFNNFIRKACELKFNRTKNNTNYENRAYARSILEVYEKTKIKYN